MKNTKYPQRTPPFSEKERGLRGRQIPPKESLRDPTGQANTKYSDNGQALVMTVMILAAVLAIALMISGIFATELRLSADVTESAKAIIAADSGIEWMLFKERKVLTGNPSFNGQPCSGLNCQLANGSSFSVQKTTGGG
ncbi:MAG: pilus assembly PilX N-terminal domain-containing protein, partial [bacterium]|nr:pilus assembly PilX N-terminal domain-containing protein [bacterium]